MHMLRGTLCNAIKWVLSGNMVVPVSGVRGVAAQSVRGNLCHAMEAQSGLYLEM